MNYFERAKKFRAKKRLGQNFLIDEKAVETILDESDITKDDIVVEIGPGLGFVTEHLVKLAKKVYAVELDEDILYLIVHDKVHVALAVTQLGVLEFVIRNTVFVLYDGKGAYAL